MQLYDFVRNSQSFTAEFFYKMQFHAKTAKENTKGAKVLRLMLKLSASA